MVPTSSRMVSRARRESAACAWRRRAAWAPVQRAERSAPGVDLAYARSGPRQHGHRAAHAARLPAAAALAAHAVEGTRKAAPRPRLQEVVECVGLERTSIAKRSRAVTTPIIGRLPAAPCFTTSETGRRHLDVEAHQVRLQFADRRAVLRGVGGTGRTISNVGRPRAAASSSPRRGQWLVVHDDALYGSVVPRSVTAPNGKVISRRSPGRGEAHGELLVLAHTVRRAVRGVFAEPDAAPLAELSTPTGSPGPSSATHQLEPVVLAAARD